MKIQFYRLETQEKFRSRVENVESLDTNFDTKEMRSLEIKKGSGLWSINPEFVLADLCYLFERIVNVKIF